MTSEHNRRRSDLSTFQRFAYEAEIAQLKKALAACEEHCDKYQWQPIDTAPKDGSIIDMYGYHTYDFDETRGFPRRFTDCRWSRERQCWEQRWFNDCDEELWTTQYQDFTHWMRKPEPPEIK